jgi:hypothetical protein
LPEGRGGISILPLVIGYRYHPLPLLPGGGELTWNGGGEFFRHRFLDEPSGRAEQEVEVKMYF